MKVCCAVSRIDCRRALFTAKAMLIKRSRRPKKKPKKSERPSGPCLTRSESLQEEDGGEQGQTRDKAGKHTEERGAEAALT